jgi:uroporphyrinogen-III synthase
MQIVGQGCCAPNQLTHLDMACFPSSSTALSFLHFSDLEKAAIGKYKQIF